MTPIHVAPAAFLGLHWRALRGEAVAAGMISGLAVTIGLVFSPLNVGLEKGLDSTACGLSTAMIGFIVNITVTVTLGLLLQWRPNLLGDPSAAASSGAALDRLDMGPKKDKALRYWPVLLAMLLLLVFCAPFCFRPGSRNKFVGDMAAWPFVALLFSGVLAAAAALGYMFLWEVRSRGVFVCVCVCFCLCVSCVCILCVHLVRKLGGEELHKTVVQCCLDRRATMLLA